MKTDDGKNSRRLFWRWVFATFWGWLLGFAFMMLGAIAADILIGAENAQFFLGLGMGAGIGYAQVRVTGPHLGISNVWGWACVVGMGAPFIASDIIRGLWPGLSYMYSIWFSAASGGVLVGLLQRRLLGALTRKANWWVPATMAGWMLAGVTPFFYGSVPGVASGAAAGVINLLAILVGGAILGAVTGGTLTWLLRTEHAV